MSLIKGERMNDNHPSSLDKTLKSESCKHHLHKKPYLLNDERIIVRKKLSRVLGLCREIYSRKSQKEWESRVQLETNLYGSLVSIIQRIYHREMDWINNLFRKMLIR